MVKASRQVVQLGTHRLSNGSCQAAAAFVRSGKLGKISRVDHPEKLKQDIPLPPVAPTNHMKNWLECMRSRRTPIADVRSGYAHSVVSIMAARAEWMGKKLYWDAKREDIVDKPVA